MKFIKTHHLFESKDQKSNYSPKNIVSEISTCMVLLNNSFLDNILDRGLKARYSENSRVFLTDLKNLLLSKNRLELPEKFTRYVENQFVLGEYIYSIFYIIFLGLLGGFFDSVEFYIEKNWDQLVNSRSSARSIIDKLLPDEKLESDLISKIYWIGPNKSDDCKEDIVVELNSGIQYSFYLNKNISLQKTASFNKFADDLLGNDIDNLFKEDNINKWDKLTQEWVRIVYENSNKNIQAHIEKFIDTNRIDSIGYFEYFDIRHSDPKFKHLGEFIPEVNKNILKLSDLLNEVWKNKENLFTDYEKVCNEWSEIKTVVLNSKILENLFTNSLKTNFPEDITKLDDNFKQAGGTVKMKLFKVLVEKMGCLERPVYYLGNNGNQFTFVPSRDFFRKNYDELVLKFDYHVNFEDVETQDDDFKMSIKLEFEDKSLLELLINIGFSGGEMSGKLNSKYKFELSSDFNYIISKASQL